MMVISMNYLSPYSAVVPVELFCIAPSSHLFCPAGWNCLVNIRAHVWTIMCLWAAAVKRTSRCDMWDSSNAVRQTLYWTTVLLYLCGGLGGPKGFRTAFVTRPVKCYSGCSKRQWKEAVETETGFPSTSGKNWGYCSKMRDGNTKLQIKYPKCA